MSTAMSCPLSAAGNRGVPHNARFFIHGLDLTHKAVQRRQSTAADGGADRAAGATKGPGDNEVDACERCILGDGDPKPTETAMVAAT